MVRRVLTISQPFMLIVVADIRADVSERDGTTAISDQGAGKEGIIGSVYRLVSGCRMMSMRFGKVYTVPELQPLNAR